MPSKLYLNMETCGHKEYNKYTRLLVLFKKY